MSNWSKAAAIAVMLALAGCGTTASPAATPTLNLLMVTTAPISATVTALLPTSASTAVVGESDVATAASTASAAVPNAQPTGSTLSLAELKYRLINQLAGGSSKAILYCDPDSYPVGIVGADQTKAPQQFPAIQQDQATFQAILTQLNLTGTTSFTPDQQLLIYREYKILRAINLQPAGDSYTFQIVYQTSSGNFQVNGTIGADGNITAQPPQPVPGKGINCPICLVAGTLIDTPSGQVAVRDLRVGMSVWTLDKHGKRQAALILKTANVAVPFGHTVVHLRLSDGRELWASPPHPIANGRPLGNLQVGDSLDGATVTSVERVQYPDDATYDILPAGDTGVYWANGILMKSTLINSAVPE